MTQSLVIHSDASFNQIPDEKTGSERVDAVVVDEEAIGSIDRPGCGAKILRGDGALEQYITNTNMKNSMVGYLIQFTENLLICYPIDQKQLTLH